MRMCWRRCVLRGAKAVEIIDSIAALRAARAALPGRVGLVPTMGALHAGHLSLVDYARAENDHVIATIFVNPTQFGAGEDFTKYPRDLARDLALFEQAGVDIVFTPTVDVIYPPGYQTYVEVTEVAQGLEGAQRPGHFRGVATVVSKLFHLAQPDHAYFGQKDAQQAAVIQRMAHDLNFPLQVVICPILREADGLAMSSRNVYLDAAQRQAAAVLYRSLQAAASAYENGERHPQTLRDVVRATLAGEPSGSVEYVSVADARTLREAETPGDAPLLLSLTVRFGATRLLDNCLLPLELNSREHLADVLGAAWQI